MSYSMYEVVFGSLFHDIGKVLQRAFDRPVDVAGQDYDLESTLCPLNKEGRYTHRHVLFTEAFFELMNRQGLQLSKGVNLAAVGKIAAYHHKPDGCDFSVAAAWMCALGDRFSAGMERRCEEDAGRSIRSYKTTPLSCLFDELILDENRLGTPGAHSYSLELLNPEDETSLIPLLRPQDGIIRELPSRYLEVWQAFLRDFKSIAQRSELGVQLFEEALLGLLERTTWAVPSSTVDLPDISLYDHSRITAAIASCLFRYHDERGEIDDVNAIKDMESPKFRFVAGDLSGIQGTLLKLASQGVKSMNKILRARSFLLGAIAESATLQLLEALRLPLCCIIQQAGGRFLVLVPATEETDGVVESLRNKWDRQLLENYTGTLALNVALTEPFAGSDFSAERFGTVMARLGQSVEEAKQTPLSHCDQGVMKREFPLDCSCSACGIRPAERLYGDEARCPTCQKEVETGSRLVRANLVLWGRNLPGTCHPVDVLGLDLALLDREALPNLDGVLSIRKTLHFKSSLPWSMRYLANHIPIFKREQDLRDPRYKIDQDESETPVVGDPKTFAHIAAEATELHHDGTMRGRPYLGLLKADVDYLGFLFQYGLRRTVMNDDRFTLSRLAQLSRMMDLYFTGYLKGLLHREFPDTYTVYAGGDDLLLIGPWTKMLELAWRIHETFRAYTGHNPNITLSAGLTLLKASHPVNRAIKEAEVFLETAKEAAGGQGTVRNRICALMAKPLPWDRYKEKLQDASWVIEQMQGENAVSTGFVYHIMKIASDAEAVAEGQVLKADWRARLAYHLSRNIKGYDDADKKRRVVQWLERLGLDNQLKLTKDYSNLYEWRLPLEIALYRNRR